MSFIDPTYLRYIVDGLNSGTLSGESSTSLPDGLVGVYEEALPPEYDIIRRKLFLDFFSLWALLKKEVSVDFAIRLLKDWTDKEVKSFIAFYSKWFNSPQSGLYTLYHEKLRVYILQKTEESTIRVTNQQIIQLCNDALKKRNGDELERYALEFLSTHLLIEAMREKDQGEYLISLSYSTDQWNRQVQVSKGFDWSKRMLNEMMLWASKHDDEHVIECALNKVDLYHMEQNDAPKIVELVAQNDIDTALARIESFGGNDKSGLQRKFILYMLCLMELTLLESRKNIFKKEIIDKLLNHLDKHIPIEHSKLKWNDFFPSYLIFQMACEWAEMELDFMRVYKRTNGWDSDWIAEKGPYTYDQMGVMKTCVLGIEWDIDNSNTLTSISLEFENLGKTEEAFYCINHIKHINEKNDALVELVKRLANQGKIDHAESAANSIEDQSRRGSALNTISNELAKRRQISKALLCAHSIDSNFWKSRSLNFIAFELFKLGEKESNSVMSESISCASDINDKYWEAIALKDISGVLMKMGKNEDATLIMQKSIACSSEIIDTFLKCRALNDISTELLNQGKTDQYFIVKNESILCIRSDVKITDLKKIKILKDISILLTIDGNLEQVLEMMSEVLLLKRGSNDAKGTSEYLLKLFAKLNEQGYPEKADYLIKKAFEYIRLDYFSWMIISNLASISSNFHLHGYNTISDYLMIEAKERYVNERLEIDKRRAIKAITKALALQDNPKNVFLFLLDKITNNQESEILHNKIKSLHEIMKGFENIEKKTETLFVLYETLPLINNLPYDHLKYETISPFIHDFVKKGKSELLLDFVDNYQFEYWKCYFLASIAAEIIIDGNAKLADKLFFRMIQIVDSIDNKDEQNRILFDISILLIKKNIVENGIEFAHTINSDIERCSALINVSIELFKMGRIDQADDLIMENLYFMKSIENKYDLSECIERICVQLSVQGFFDIAIDNARSLIKKIPKIRSLSVISTNLKKSDPEKSQLIMEEVISIANGLNDKDKDWAFFNISTEYAKQGEIEMALLYVNQILQENVKSQCLFNITIFFIKKKKIKDAFDCAQNIISGYWKSKAFKEMSLELAKSDFWDIVEKSTLEISISSIQTECTEEVAINHLKVMGFNKSNQLINTFQNRDFKTSMMTSLIKQLEINSTSTSICLHVFKNRGIPISSLIHALHLYILNQLFFGNFNEITINRFNRTLNLQWAIDIKNEISKASAA